MKANFSFEFDSQKLKHVWILLILPSLLIGLLVFGYIGVFQLDPADAGTNDKVRKALPYILGLNHLIVFGILLYILRKRGESLSNIGWNWEVISTKVWQEILIGILAAFGIYLFKEFFLDSIRALLAGNKPTFTSLFNFRFQDMYLPMAIVATTLIFIEESVFRGFAIPRLGDKYGLMWGTLISTVFFAFIHWGNGPFALFSTFLIGLLMALIFIKRGDLLAVTIAHAGYNFLVLAT